MLRMSEKNRPDPALNPTRQGERAVTAIHAFADRASALASREDEQIARHAFALVPRRPGMNHPPLLE
jgi:hypothetical protein